MLLLDWLLRLFGLVRGFGLRSSFGCFLCPLFRVPLFVPSSCFGTNTAVWAGRTDVLRHAAKNGGENKMYYISAMWISKSHAKVKGESLLFTSFFLVMSSKENQRSISH